MAISVSLQFGVKGLLERPHDASQQSEAFVIAADFTDYGSKDSRPVAIFQGNRRNPERLTALHRLPVLFEGGVPERVIGYGHLPVTCREPRLDKGSVPHVWIGEQLVSGMRRLAHGGVDMCRSSVFLDAGHLCQNLQKRSLTPRARPTKVPHSEFGYPKRE